MCCYHNYTYHHDYVCDKLGDEFCKNAGSDYLEIAVKAGLCVHTPLKLVGRFQASFVNKHYLNISGIFLEDLHYNFYIETALHHRQYQPLWNGWDRT